jgi:hypothetical protein
MILQIVLALAGVVWAAPVKLRQEVLTLPTYRENDPDVNAPHDLFRPKGPFVYPYTMRTGLGGPKSDQPWRVLVLENEYLLCRVLPDLGGRLYGCRDKLSGQEMFFANPVIKKDWIAARAAWASLGIEQSFPMAHSFQSVSPVQFATVQSEDGSASAVVGAVDRVSGMEWRVTYTLHPEKAYLEQRVRLYNRGDARQRYHWWSNAAIRLGEAPLIFTLPAYVTEPHGPGKLESWPVSASGVDRSSTANHKESTGFFAYASREPFFGVWRPDTRTGVVHYANAETVPGKKIWIWGSDGDQYVKKGLTDDGSSYAEIQAGVFPYQDTFAFLEPQASRTFTEYWIPLRDIGGITRSTPAAALHLRRSDGGLAVEVAVTSAAEGAKIRVTQGEQAAAEWTADLAPTATFRRIIESPAEGPHTVQVLDRDGALLLTHTEGVYDAVKFADAAPRPASDSGKRETAGDFVDAGAALELQAFRDAALAEYQKGLARFESSAPLKKAHGRLLASLGRTAEGAAALANPADAEAAYYRGLTQSRSGDDGAAWNTWDAIRGDAVYGAAAKIQLAGILARAGERKAAAELLAEVDTPRASALKSVLDRRLGNAASPGDLLDTLARAERNEDAVWPQLAQEPEWILDIAADYLHLGLWEDALAVLSRTYPPPPANSTEPGAVAPQSHPMVSYYRAYAKQKLGQPADADFRLAASQPVRFVFPSRWVEFAILRAATAFNDNDANAHFLLGHLCMHSRMAPEAKAEWQKAQRLNAALPGLAESLKQATALAP